MYFFFFFFYLTSRTKLRDILNGNVAIVLLMASVYWSRTLPIHAKRREKKSFQFLGINQTHEITRSSDPSVYRIGKKSYHCSTQRIVTVNQMAWQRGRERGISRLLFFLLCMYFLSSFHSFFHSLFLRGFVCAVWVFRPVISQL